MHPKLETVNTLYRYQAGFGRCSLGTCIINVQQQAISSTPEGPIRLVTFSGWTNAVMSPGMTIFMQIKVELKKLLVDLLTEAGMVWARLQPYPASFLCTKWRTKELELKGPMAVITSDSGLKIRQWAANLEVAFCKTEGLRVLTYHHIAWPAYSYAEWGAISPTCQIAVCLQMHLIRSKSFEKHGAVLIRPRRHYKYQTSFLW